jgi:hypothetical protein
MLDAHTTLTIIILTGAVVSTACLLIGTWLRFTP